MLASIPLGAGGGAWRRYDFLSSKQVSDAYTHINPASESRLNKCVYRTSIHYVEVQFLSALGAGQYIARSSPYQFNL